MEDRNVIDEGVVEFNLTLLKADLLAEEGRGYIVFGPAGDDKGARPKFTLTREQWQSVGEPINVTVIAHARTRDLTPA